MQPTLDNRCVRLVEGLGLARRGDIVSVEPLTGGVASDIAVVDLGSRRIAVKFALEKLKVREEWHAPVRRNKAEYDWLGFAQRAVPGAAPALFGRDPSLNGFAMDFLAGKRIFLWKSALLKGRTGEIEAAKVGSALGRIHRASAETGFDSSPFQNQDDFHALRLEPYLIFLASRYPSLESELKDLVVTQQRNQSVLIHGDISPKNILFKDGEPVFLDAECATMGDPSFDVAFCLNHLVLKSFHMPDLAAVLLSAIRVLWQRYAEHVNWEAAGVLERRVCALLPALMLARIDGKSPVEYLDDATRERVREVSVPLVMQPPVDLSDMLQVLSSLHGVGSP